MSFAIEMDEGEEAPVRFDVVEATAPWDDLSDATITLRLRGDDAMLYTSTDVTLDAPGADGRVRGGSVLAPGAAPGGIYSAELEVRKPSRARPKIEQGTVSVRARPAKPPA